MRAAGGVCALLVALSVLRSSWPLGARRWGRSWRRGGALARFRLVVLGWAHAREHSPGQTLEQTPPASRALGRAEVSPCSPPGARRVVLGLDFGVIALWASGAGRHSGAARWVSVNGRLSWGPRQP